MNVLFTSAGRRVELLNCFRSDAVSLGMPLRVLAVDLSPAHSAACRTADLWFAVPRCGEPNYVPSLLELCRGQNVSLVVPTIDTELQVLADAREQFRAIGVTVAISAPEIVRMARNKFETAKFLRENGVAVPRTGWLEELLNDPDGWRWPVILKPAGGSSSKGIEVLRDPGALRRLPKLADDYIAQEWWEGIEYTVNVYFDRSGRHRTSVPHRRIETRTGEVSKGTTERLPILMNIAERLGRALSGAFGALCFQAIVTSTGEAVVFEINARFGGGYPLAHAAGARFSRWLLEEVVGLPVSAHDQWKDGLTMLRYDAAVFVGEDSSPRA